MAIQGGSAADEVVWKTAPSAQTTNMPGQGDNGSTNGSSG
eukprot:CAMPEP_0170754906 /NCGR_PEP_ID=MMETSP0437-20130122/13244_1 /TAXON_ID=0 /ORGANISM="Sexangularia sp." /LENGTH=39 /DNA_ID= /DNA_START= /DNA_END= /DNA_ORIENTATION=